MTVQGDWLEAMRAELAGPCCCRDSHAGTGTCQSAAETGLWLGAERVLMCHPCADARSYQRHSDAALG